MTNQSPSNSAAGHDLYSTLGLCLLAFSSIVVEIALTKFVSFKVYHHFVYAIISTVILSFGFAGTTVYLRSSQFGVNTPAAWGRVARCAAIYALALPLCVVLFSWIPIDPYDMSAPPLLRILSLPLYFCIFAVPFFFAGLSISHVFAASRMPVRLIFFWDLLAAGAGAALCPLLLELLGGYMTICFSAFLGLLSFLAFRQLVGAKPEGKGAAIVTVGAFLLVAILTAAYPDWARAIYGFEIRSHKDIGYRTTVMEDFKGVDKTMWNAVARIDVSRTGESSRSEFTYGLSPSKDNARLKGRLVLVDGGAATRQFVVKEPIQSESFLPRSFWASAYAARPSISRQLILGGGGGVDILIAKFFKTANVDVVEMNPSTAKHLLTGGDASERSLYQSKLESDADTRVEIYNQEGRHFCTTRPESMYDLVQASGVDTLTAVTSGALSLVENHLYTSTAVGEYARILKPDGVLSLTHWRFNPPSTALRMLATYMDYLDKHNVQNPWRNILVTGDDWWCDIMMKKSPFTKEEVASVRQWCQSTGRSILVAPDKSGGLAVKPGEEVYDFVARASKCDREKFFQTYKLDVTPVDDDKPYFYGVERWTGAGAFYLLHGSTPFLLLIVASIFALTLTLLPLIKLGKRSERLDLVLIPCSIYFAISSFAFLLFEISLLQLFTIFVGGPVYSLSVTLLAVLAGYGTGSLIAQRFNLNRTTFLAFALALPLLMVALYLAIPIAINAFMPLPDAGRIAVAFLITFVAAIFVGMPVPTAMAVVRSQYESAIAWMWGISSGFNAIGAMSFILITRFTGISETLILVGVLYSVANLIFVAVLPLAQRSAQRRQGA